MVPTSLSVSVLYAHKEPVSLDAKQSIQPAPTATATAMVYRTCLYWIMA